MVPSLLRNLMIVASVFGIGLVAGLLVGTGMSMYSARKLPDLPWTARFQAEDLLFSKSMPPFFLVALFLLVVAACLTGGTIRASFLALPPC